MSSRTGEAATAPSPLDLMMEAVTLAAEDAGRMSLLERVDTVVSLPGHSWASADPARELADALGLDPTRTPLAATGGQTGVAAFNWAAEEIREGRSRAVLFVGSNNVRTVDVAARRGIEIFWPGRICEAAEAIGSFRHDGSSPEEDAVGLDRPIYVYPLFENALRAWRGQSLADHREFMGRLFSPFTRVAAENPAAWFPVERSPEELVTVTQANRMIGFPYTKYLNAVISTDQSAAVLMTSSEWADEQSIGADARVHWWGGAAATEEAWYVSSRPDLAFCPAMSRCHRMALANASVGIDEVDAFDFYSCFPAAVEMALRVLDLQADDGRPFTVTGGLPYAGGPGSCYTLHSLASMYQRLRESATEIGMVTGNGWYLTKHSAVILSAMTPRPASPTSDGNGFALNSAAEATEPLRVRRGSGPGRIVSYTVAHDREGRPIRGAVVGSFDDGSRFVAETPSGAEFLLKMESVEMVGEAGWVVDETDRPLRFELG
jgi:acetyl-CoA C-acetyltransferase